MPRSPKTPKINEFNTYKNAFGPWHQHGEDWESFLPDYPLTIELGSGKAEFSLQLAQKYPKKAFLAVDLKSDRLWRGAKTATELNLNNIAFLQANIAKLEQKARPLSFEEAWITFPDPYPKDRHEKHRLTHPKFLKIYQKILKEGGIVHLKTDSDSLWAYTNQVLRNKKDAKIIFRTENLHDEGESLDAKLLTAYEKRWIEDGRVIKYVSFSL